MSAIYSDKHNGLSELLTLAGRSGDATLLIPDLQRPYVWNPQQVIVLVDSLIRGWPFGTLLTWKVKSDDPVRSLARPFWRVVDRVGDKTEDAIDAMHPPSDFQMVLDGQQRVQSMLLALGGDGWGFKLLDRQWHEILSGTKPRGPRGRAHWSLGCLCIDTDELYNEYEIKRRANAIDYSKVLRWVVTDNANGQSQLAKPPTYREPLPISSAFGGQYIRLSRLWDTAPDRTASDVYAAEDLAAKLLADHGASSADCHKKKRAMAACLLALADVKQTRVTYLELQGYSEVAGPREDYNDAIVNIFTRLNTAGRTLTREDITFAWLKVGWNASRTNGESAKASIEKLAKQLDELSLAVPTDDVVSALTFVWSASFNEGKLLDNNDLMRGEAIRPMAADVSENWDLMVDSALTICAKLDERGLKFRLQYQSLNALAFLWAWYFIANHWRSNHHLSVTATDSFEKRLTEILDEFVDRWLICSQWAGMWQSGSSQSLGALVGKLHACAVDVEERTEPLEVTELLRSFLDQQVAALDVDAIRGLATIRADERQEVRFYFTPLWLWNRLDRDRYVSSGLTLREGKRAAAKLEVDHIVAYKIWSDKSDALQTSNETQNEDDLTGSLDGGVNDLGNCMLLEKNFNISKGTKPLASFLTDVHEFSNNSMQVSDWARAMDIEPLFAASGDVEIHELSRLCAVRTSRIRADLESFIRGKKRRVDLEPQ